MLGVNSGKFNFAVGLGKFGRGLRGALYSRTIPDNYLFQELEGINTQEVTLEELSSQE